MGYVVEIAFHAFFHHPEFWRFATVAQHLCIACYAWLASVAIGIVAYQLGVFLGVIEHVWAWPDDAHVAFDDVYQIGQLVDVGAPHELAEAEQTRVVRGGLPCVALTVDAHGAKLVAHKGAPIEPCASLAEEDGPSTLPLDNQRNEWGEGQGDDTDYQCCKHIKHPLYKSTINRRDAPCAVVGSGHVV